MNTKESKRKDGKDQNWKILKTKAENVKHYIIKNDNLNIENLYSKDCLSFCDVFISLNYSEKRSNIPKSIEVALEKYTNSRKFKYYRECNFEIEYNGNSSSKRIDHILFNEQKNKAILIETKTIISFDGIAGSAAQARLIEIKHEKNNFIIEFKIKSENKKLHCRDIKYLAISTNHGKSVDFWSKCIPPLIGLKENMELISLFSKENENENADQIIELIKKMDKFLA